MLLQLLLLLLLIHYAAAATLQPLHPDSKIPAFPEQSTASASSSSCPLTFPLRRPPPPTLHQSCSSSFPRLRCCPALATLLFSSYPLRDPSSTKPSGFDMPEVPEDTETCSEEVGKALRETGIDVSYHNASCDLVFCYCGIRLHRLSCDMVDGLFREKVELLTRDCRSSGITGCSKCLTSLYTLSSSDSANEEASDRAAKMHGQDCQLMGLAWLLAKNHSAYAPTVTSVFRAMMSTRDGTVPKSPCTVGSDDLPLAANSTEVPVSKSSPQTRPRPVGIGIGVGIFLAIARPLHQSFLVI